MADYDLNRLGHAGFEQLTAAICLRAFGASVEFFGRGADGGREATFNGTIRWSATADRGTDEWVGYTVLQAKFREEPSSKPNENAAWLWGELKKEIDSWRRRAATQPVPQYLLFATNVRLSAVAELGGIDTISRNLKEHIEGRPADDQREAIDRLEGVKGWKVWHSDQIGNYLNAYPELRHAFPAFLTPGDVLANLGQSTDGVESLGATMRTHVTQALHNERWIRLSESGSATGEKASLEQVAIDLPAQRTLDGPDSRNTVELVQTAQHIIEEGDRVLRPTLLHAIEPRHFVILGGAGQGKTTLSYLIAQAYRLAILRESDPGPETASLLAETQSRLAELGLKMPGNRRWPMRIDLAEYGEAISSGAELGILKWLAMKISARLSGDVTATQLLSWLRAWPWILLLDGLDEVTAASVRQRLMDCIEDFRVEAGSVDADLMIVATSRPLGYEGEFDHRFTELRLARLPVDTAIDYARMVAAVRHREDPELRDQVMARMIEAASDSARRLLMETPLQVTVMSFILERFPLLPPDRYSLFSRYYDTMYARESSKRTQLAKLLVDYRVHVEYIHERVGLYLQTAEELPALGVATMSTRDLLEITRTRLSSVGYSESEVEKISAELIKAATHRLVLLVPQGDQIGFEIRTLQELMAARALTSGADEDVLRRLGATTYSPHWRNTWLLATGRIFAEREHLSEKVVGLLDSIDADPRRLGKVFPTAPEVAADMLSDRLAENRPALRRRILFKVLEVLAGPPPSDSYPYARALMAAAREVAQYDAIFSRLKAAAMGNDRDRASAALLLDALTQMSAESTEVAVKAELMRSGIRLTDAQRAAVAQWGTRHNVHRAEDAVDDGAPKQPSVLREFLRPALEKAGLEPETLESALILPDLSKLPIKVRKGKFYAEPRSGSVGQMVMTDVETASALEMALASIEPEHWPVSAVLQVAIRSRLARLPVQNILT